MTKFIFENKDKKAFKDCSDEEMLLIIKSNLGEGVCQRYYSCRPQWAETNKSPIQMVSIYRVLAPEPVPNWIDWGQCPVWAKYCFTCPSGNSYISSHKPSNDGHIAGRSIAIDGFPFFERRTIAPEDSLLVRPEDL